MKIRSSFVSNSSSSSFIVKIVEDNSCCECCGQYLPDSIFRKLSDMKTSESERDKDPVSIKNQKDLMDNARDFEELNEIRNKIYDDFRDLYLVEVEEGNGDRRDLLYGRNNIEFIHEVGVY